MAWFTDHRYGKPKYQDYDGAGWPEFIRRCRATKLDGVKEQTPQVKYAKPDKSRLRAKECVHRFMKLLRRRA